MTRAILPWTVPRHLERVRRLAREVAGTAFAWVTCIHEQELHIVCGEASDPPSVPREISLCQGVYAAPDGCMTVPDTRADDRWVINPLVSGPYNLRSYHGIALRDPGDGRVLGVLAVGDREPWTPDATVREVMVQLAALVGRDLALAMTPGATGAAAAAGGAMTQAAAPVVGALWREQARAPLAVFRWTQARRLLIQRQGARHEQRADADAVIAALLHGRDVPGEARGRLTAALAALGAGRGGAIHERLCDRSQGLRWLELRAEGTPGSVVGTLHDITPAEVLRAVLPAAPGRQGMLVRLLDAVADLALLCAADGRVAEANRPARQALAGSAALRDLFGAAAAAELLGAAAAEARRTGSAARWLGWTDADGHRHDGQVTVGVHDDGVGGELLSVVVCDRTREALLEHEAGELRERLGTGDRLQRDILALVNHELRTPLTAILGSLDLLRDLVGEQGRELVEVLGAGADRLHALTAEMLAAAELAGGHLRAAPAPTLLRACIAEPVRQLIAQARGRGVVVRWRLGPELDAVAGLDGSLCRRMIMAAGAVALEHAHARGLLDIAAGIEERRGLWCRIRVHGDADAVTAVQHRGFAEAGLVHRAGNHGLGLSLPVAEHCARLLGGQLDLISSLPPALLGRIPLAGDPERRALPAPRGRLLVALADPEQRRNVTADLQPHTVDGGFTVMDVEPAALAAGLPEARWLLAEEAAAPFLAAAATRAGVRVLASGGAGIDPLAKDELLAALARD